MKNKVLERRVSVIGNGSIVQFTRKYQGDFWHQRTHQGITPSSLGRVVRILKASGEPNLLAMLWKLV